MKAEKPLRPSEIRTIREILYEKTGVCLKNYLIEQAFTRSSYSKKFGGGSNENLEYIGDTILGYHVVKKLYDYYGSICSDDTSDYYSFRSHERDFTALKSTIVSNKTLAAIIDEWDLCRYLVVGKSDAVNEVDKQVKIRADLFEAIIGAYAVQENWNQEILGKIISKVLPLEEMILKYENDNYRLPEFSAENAVTTLKEMAEREECDFPKYEMFECDINRSTGSDIPRWTCRITIPCWVTTILVTANSKKDAKKYAAYLALCNRFNLPNQYGPSKQLMFWDFDGKNLRPLTADDYRK